MTSQTVALGIYGPVRDDIALVEKLLGSLRPTDFPALGRMLDNVLEAGGKRVRPALALLAGKLTNYNLDLLVPLAGSIELLHTATLVHDDVIDAAPTRRGRSTANSLVGNAASVMVGDYMFAHAAELVARTGNIDVIRLFARTLMEMATGELHQDMSAYSYGQSTREYFNRIAGKTASLFATAAQGGAMIGGASPEHAEALRSYGENIGMAFQVVDDLLDVTGTEEELGKPAGSDLMQGTITLPALLLIERYPENNPVKRYFAGKQKADSLRRYLEMVHESNIVDEAFDVALDFRNRALSALESIPASEAKDSLTDVAYWVTQRRS
ncbi:MAG TPA: polyprenyl synthetase family protein [Dehalococcoidia bacterium]|nr:polyprenyl synthetase family protein [Dehalococcoidia bacterium]